MLVIIHFCYVFLLYSEFANSFQAMSQYLFAMPGSNKQVCNTLPGKNSGRISTQYSISVRKFVPIYHNKEQAIEASQSIQTLCLEIMPLEQLVFTCVVEGYDGLYPVCFLKGLVFAGVLAIEESNVNKLHISLYYKNNCVICKQLHISLQRCGCFTLLSYSC